MLSGMLVITNNRLFSGNMKFVLFAWLILYASFSSFPQNRINGVSVGLVNHAADVRGLQIGLFNKTIELKGFQFGLWNMNEKRRLPIVNWDFKSGD